MGGGAFFTGSHMFKTKTANGIVLLTVCHVTIF